MKHINRLKKKNHDFINSWQKKHMTKYKTIYAKNP